jgi:hypothetical protein
MPVNGAAFDPRAIERIDYLYGHCGFVEDSADSLQ